MERVFVVALLVSLCSATSPPFPSIISLECNETQSETNVAMDLINDQRDDGFVLRPVRVESVTQQQSVKHGGFIYYLDLDVIETDCSVLSGKSWRDCSSDIPFHEMVFGHCKAIVFIAKPWRILKLLNYNCTLGTVPFSSVVMMCPDCPGLVTDITPAIKAKADLLIEKFNKDSNETHYFKVDDIERVRTQHVFGPSYFLSFTIKEAECLKTQAVANLADCKSMKDKEAHVGFCKGSVYNTVTEKQGLSVNCEIYDPRDDDEHCDHGSDSSKTEQGQEKANTEETKVQQEGNGEAGQGKDAPSKCKHHKHGHCPHHRGRKHHGCRHEHHHHHPHHHHHHHHDHLNDSHPHDPSHHHHHHHHDHQNHTKSDDGSSSEEHIDNKPFEKRSKGSVQFYYLSKDENSVPVPTIVRPPSPPERPGKHGRHDNIVFPSEPSKLNTCPGEPLVKLPIIVEKFLFT